MDDNYVFKQNLRVLYSGEECPGILYTGDEGRLIQHDYDVVFSVSFPYHYDFENATVNITYGNYSFYKNLDEITPTWENGQYYYDITLKDLNSFETLEDKSIIYVILRYYDYENEEPYHAKISSAFVLKNTDEMRIFDRSVMDEDWIYVGTREVDDDELSYNISSDDIENDFAVVTILELIKENVSDGKICIYSGEYLIFEKYLKDFDSDNMGYDYPSLSDIYIVYFKELDLTNARDKDLVRIEFFSQNDDAENCEVVYHIDGDLRIFYGFDEDMNLADDESYLGNISKLE